MTTKLQTLGRRSAVVLVTAAGFVAAATPAHADVPEGWARPGSVDKVYMLLVLGGIPLLLFVGIAVLVYLPSLIRGERIAPGAPAIENQWLGGPRKATAELAAPDSEESDAGGASARW
ncbi:MAG: hypothetical protein JWO11_899 [Nocardioides sp.]|nr:hypothetical protein [Nocardioides sp.]